MPIDINRLQISFDYSCVKITAIRFIMVRFSNVFKAEARLLNKLFHIITRMVKLRFADS